jgi:hypothetical protein
MKNIWRKQLLKACDFSLTIESMCAVWPYTEHEPFIVLPLSMHEPWNLRGTKPVVDLEDDFNEVP